MPSRNNSTAVVRNKETNKLETICLDTGEVLTQDVDLSKFRFQLETAMLICQAIREGATLKSIGDNPAFPSLTVVHYWRRSNATFDEEIRMARKDRAEYYHDKVLEIAEDTIDRDDVVVAKFKADQYKWAAEKGDPSSYGNKIEHSGSNVAPTIVVMTGIDRKPDIEVIDYEEVQNTESRREICDVDGGGVRADVHASSETTDEETIAEREEET